MTAVFLIVWFYLYAGLLFGMSSRAMGLFPRIGSFWQVIGWPIFSFAYLFKLVMGEC